MNESEPQDLRPTLDQLLRGALKPLFGENLPLYFAEVERHDAEIRELQERARTVTQELLNTAIDRITFFGGDRLAALGEAHANTRAQREAVDTELHEALVEAKERHRRKVKALMEDAKDGE